jgi:hypothetical protein
MLTIDLIDDPSDNRTGTKTRSVKIPGAMLGFAPAYLNSQTGEMMLSTFANGSPAPIHLLEGLPADWVAAQTEAGKTGVLKDTVISGYIRDNRFFTREQATATAEQESADRSSGSAYYDAF